METEFIDLAKQGKRGWWRYVLGILLILFCWQGSAIALYVAIIAWVRFDEDPTTSFDTQSQSLVGIDPFLNYLVLSAGAIMLVASIWVVVRFVHGRPLMTLVAPDRRIDRALLWRAFWIYTALLVLSTALDYLLHPEFYSLTEAPWRLLRLAPLVLILTPIQTTGEELLFRGYLLQMTGQLTRNHLVLAFISGLIFLLPHLGNPEIEKGWAIAPIYFGFGFLFAIITLKNNRLEGALGAHAANNLFSALVVNYEDGVLDTESVFTASEFIPVETLALFAFVALSFYLFMYGYREQDARGSACERSDQSEAIDGVAPGDPDPPSKSNRAEAE